MSIVFPDGRDHCGERVSLDLHRLVPGECVQFAAPDGEEAVLVLLEGEVEWAGRVSGRRSVFADPAAAVYLPATTVVRVRAAARSELAFLATLDAGIAGSGEPPTLVEGVVRAECLIVGETFTAPGEWSSFTTRAPFERVVAGIEELYHFRCDPPDGFGLQGLAASGSEREAVIVRDGAVVGLAGGHHPICAAPGTSLYALWALAGPAAQLGAFDDPRHHVLRPLGSVADSGDDR